MDSLTGSTSRAARARALMELVAWQVGFGHRYPGSDGHAAFHRALYDRLRATGLRVHVQEFPLLFGGRTCRCANYVVHVPCPSKPAAGPILIGTHFDSRCIADRERDPRARERPILGANDGGSGTAILVHLLEHLPRSGADRDVLVAFFDAEDVGGIEGHPFSVGAHWLASRPVPFAAEQVLVLDMVGGRDLALDVDAHALDHEPSRRFTAEVFALGSSLGVHAFAAPKPDKVKYVVCDHSPFLARGAATCLLIDIDYPQWHTQADLPEAMSGESLASIEDVLLAYLFRVAPA